VYNLIVLAAMTPAAMALANHKSSITDPPNKMAVKPGI
jgi:hypothetical protein